MIRALLFVCSLLLFVGCEEEQTPRRYPCDGQSCPAYQPETVEVPIVNAPIEARQSNWVKYGSGSCYYASIISNLIYQGKESEAAWIRANCGGAASTRDIANVLDRLGIKYAVTASGNVNFLEWAVRTRRGVAFPFFPRHAINLVHLDDQWAALQDNNDVGHPIWIRRDEFLAAWRHKYGGCAITAICSPAPPPLRT